MWRLLCAGVAEAGVNAFHKAGEASPHISRPPGGFFGCYSSKHLPQHPREGACWQQNLRHCPRPTEPNLQFSKILQLVPCSFKFEQHWSREVTSALEKGKTCACLQESLENKKPIFPQNYLFFNSEKSKCAPASGTQTAGLPHHPETFRVSASRPGSQLTASHSALFRVCLEIWTVFLSHLSSYYLALLCNKPSSCTKPKATQAQPQGSAMLVQGQVWEGQKSSCQPYPPHCSAGAWRTLVLPLPPNPGPLVTDLKPPLASSWGCWGWKPLSCCLS